MFSEVCRNFNTAKKLCENHGTLLSPKKKKSLLIVNQYLLGGVFNLKSRMIVQYHDEQKLSSSS